jgi:hypothetical protein
LVEDENGDLLADYHSRRSKIHPSKRSDILRFQDFLRLFKEADDGESSNIIPLPKTFREGRVVLYGCEARSRTLRDDDRLRAFVMKVLRRIAGPKWNEATGDWRKLHHEVLHSLYSSPYIIRVKKSRRMKWGHVARMREMRNAQKVWLESRKGRDYSANADVNGRILVKWILEKQGLGLWMDSFSSGNWLVSESCERCN